MATVRMSLEKTNTQPYTPAGDVKVTYNEDTNNDHSVAWENYLTGSSLDMSRSGGTYTMSGVNKIVIKEYEIKILGI